MMRYIRSSVIVFLCMTIGFVNAKELQVHNYLDNSADIELRFVDSTRVERKHVEKRRGARSSKESFSFNDNLASITINVASGKKPFAYVDNDAILAKEINSEMKSARRGVVLILEYTGKGDAKKVTHRFRDIRF